MTWKQKTHSVIQDCFIEFASATGRIIGPSSSDKDKTEVMRMIRSSYPFGQRKHFPYKVWCAEVSKVKTWLYQKESSCATGLFE